jgi:sugar phosphate isomerase/epimerase
VPEFRRHDGETGYDALLRLTDPALVTMQLDCGWVSVAGLDPADYLRKHPQRFELLHMKDVHRDSAGSHSTRPQFVPAGAGVVDWRNTLAAARDIGIRYGYIEIEGDYGLAPLEGVARSYDYLRGVI